VVLTLALGIGANAAIFSIVDAVLLKAIPLPGSDRLVIFTTHNPNGSTQNASPSKFQHWQRQTQVVEAVTAFRDNVVNHSGSGTPQQLRVGEVTPNYFDLFGAPVTRGRTFSQAEASPGADRVVVISHRLWVTRFAADPAVVGTTMTLNGEPHSVIGIIAADFHMEEFGTSADAWVPFQLKPNSDDHGHYFSAGARLRSGVSLAQANAQLDLSAEEFRRRFPRWLAADATFRLVSLKETLIGDVRKPLVVLQAAVTFLFLIACANVASLLMVRAISRRREIAVRLAMGAGRGRIIRHLLAEGLLLGTAGGLLGLVVGLWGIRALLAVDTAGLPRVTSDGAGVILDWRLMGFTALLSLGTAIVFSLIPVIQRSRGSLADTLRVSGRAGAGIQQRRAQGVLVVVQIALAMILTVGAGLFIRTLYALNAIDPGFNSANVLTMRMSLAGPEFAATADVSRFVENARARLSGIAGVEHVTAGCCLPLAGAYTLPFIIARRPLANEGFHGATDWFGVAPDYLNVFRITVTRGRPLTERDTAQAPAVALINEAMARRFWPNGDPLQERLLIGKGVLPQFDAEPNRQIVGIVADIRDEALRTDPVPTVYVPLAQVTDAFNALSVQTTPLVWAFRTRTQPHAVSTGLQQSLQEITGLPVAEVRTMTDIVSRSIARERFNMVLMTTFALCALALAAIGLYGLTAYAVQQRTGEIAIRMALGAVGRDVSTMIVRQGMRLAIAGVVLGAVGAYALTSAVGGLLFGVEPRDPALFAGLAVLLATITLLATWLPARRASRVDPLVALRYE
jgi:predicted permease